MSRAGYDGDCDDNESMLRAYGWQANVRRCIKGSKGQAFMWELYQSLEALTSRTLTQGALQNTVTGEVCSLGAVAVHRGMAIAPEFCTTGAEDDEPDEYEFASAMGPLFGIKDMLAREVMFQNDEGDTWHWEDDGSVCHWTSYGETRKVRLHDLPAERWQRMRKWVVENLRDIP